MAEKTFWESIKSESENVVEKLKQLIHEGNVRRIVIQHQGRTVAEFPVTAGVVGALLAPVLAAIGAIVALLKDCTIQVERDNSQGTGGARVGPTVTTPRDGTGQSADWSRCRQNHCDTDASDCSRA